MRTSPAVERSRLGRSWAWLRSRRGRRVVVSVLLAPVVAFALLVAVTPLPDELKHDHELDGSIRVLDRSGNALAEVRADDGARARWVPLRELGAQMPRVMMAAEDKRFRWHPGVDPIAIGRAIVQNLSAGRIVSGASTLTQQLGRNLVHRPRTIPGKIKEMAVAVRIELSLSKDRILESYLNLVNFGPNLRGVEAASRFYFDKPTSKLSLAEAATLAAMPKGPSIYDPRRNPKLLRRRRDEILDRVGRLGWASSEQVQRAKRQPLQVHLGATGWSAPHFVRDLLQGKIRTGFGPLKGRVSELHTTLDRGLQREVQTATRQVVRRLRTKHVSAASVVVLDNSTGGVLAWVGSPSFFDQNNGGQNDGVIARRQPGSSLKPFVYGLAMERLGWTAATVLPDVALHFPGIHGTYSPKNYDERFHGPVLLRQALANSLNVPAVYTASVLGPAAVLQRLRKLGFSTLDAPASEYGVAIALGDGTVRLLDLANAYASLARGGLWRPVRPLLGVKDVEGHALRARERRGSTRVMPRNVTTIITDILADPNARLASFGPNSPLEFSFPVAAKTGTSKGFRDNITVGFSPSVTVAVWVGNFDGSPMQGVSGVTGAGPLFQTVMQAAQRRFGHAGDRFRIPEKGFVRARVCGLSGRAPTDACPHVRDEWFIRGSEPRRPCNMHELVRIDDRNGLRAGSGCPDEHVQEQSFEVFPARYRAWAVAAKRKLAPERWSPLCPGTETDGPSAAAGGGLRVRYPYEGAVFLLDPSMPVGAQGLVLRAEASGGVDRVTFYVDGKPVGVRAAPFELPVKLTKGRHRVWVAARGQRSRPVAFSVK